MEDGRGDKKGKEGRLEGEGRGGEGKNNERGFAHHKRVPGMRLTPRPGDLRAEVMTIDSHKGTELDGRPPALPSPFSVVPAQVPALLHASFLLQVNSPPLIANRTLDAPCWVSGHYIKVSK